MTPQSLVALAVAMLLQVGPAEESDRTDVQSAIEQGGWQVVYGPLMTAAEVKSLYPDFESARELGNRSCLLTSLKASSLGILEKLAAARPELSREPWSRHVKHAITKLDGSLQTDRVEVRFGVATYRRWRIVVTQERKVRMVKKQKRTLGHSLQWYEPESYMTTVESRIPMPSRYQTYLAIRGTR